MRYGNFIAYFVYIIVLIGWMVLSYTTAIWRQNIPMAAGWFIAYAIIPLYAFRLVHDLRQNVKKLHSNLDATTFQAEHDQLTQMPNRKLFEKELIYFINNYKKFALLFIDLDGFKAINDTYGHDIGDKVLKEVSKRLQLYPHFSARLGRR